MRKTMIVGAGVLVAALVCLNQTPGQTQTKETIISIEDLDCPTCAKKVEKAVSAVAGVAAVKTDVDKQTATVTPEAGKTPSPRSMWEAVEKAGFKPLKLTGPGGTFTEKPST
jgi:copper chaperone CopZ